MTGFFAGKCLHELFSDIILVHAFFFGSDFLGAKCPAPRVEATKSGQIDFRDLNESLNTALSTIFLYCRTVKKRMENITFVQCQNLKCFQGSIVQIPLKWAYALTSHHKFYRIRSQFFLEQANDVMVQ